ncbi:Bidirectional sugar transporter SWEET [Quillaja saponaria]|uniref:Bidirectional sugar transporter SWEET n=1 Tax=Quillaja saponaria TaxID=32244 RepID=A0AAD7LCZ3_QUISA|nr:Bidirectional sugar transporter SWEET [Quillaja saponaria]
MKIKTGILIGILDVGFFGAALIVSQLALERETRINAIGLMAAGLNIVMYGSPLAAMKTVVMTKSVEYMPFFLSFFFFLNGGIWFFYALLVQDKFLAVPNGTGFLLGLVQLILYAIYRKGKPLQHNIGGLEEGLQHEHLISPS